MVWPVSSDEWLKAHNEANKRWQEKKRELYQQVAGLHAKIIVALANPNDDTLRDALDAEYDLTGDCSVVGPIADLVGYSEDDLEGL